NCFQLDPFVGINRGQFLEWTQALIFGRVLPIDREQLDQLRATAAATRFAVNPHSVAKGEAAHDFRRDENVLRCLNEITFGVTQKPKAFAGDFDDSFTKFGFALALLAFGSFQGFGGNRIAAGSARGVVAGLVVSVVEIVVAVAPVIT